MGGYLLIKKFLDNNWFKALNLPQGRFFNQSDNQLL